MEIREYRLLEVIGQGGMGTVYKAWHTRLDIPVAMKLVNDRRDHSPERVARFDREMKAIGGLDHPNIVRALDAGESSGTRFLVMEFVDGQTMSERVRHDGPLSAERACEWIRQAALGLDHIHQRGLVHRDIKPSNLMVETSSDNGSSTECVKILDLGIALIAQDAGVESDGGLTDQQQVMGTYDFLAPEQALGCHHVDIRVDIYALGCTLYFLLTGKAPFSDQRSVEKLVSHQLHSPAALSEHVTDPPIELVAIVEKMIAKSPERRFQSPLELAKALSELDLTKRSLSPSKFSPVRWVGLAGAILALIYVVLSLDEPIRDPTPRPSMLSDVERSGVDRDRLPKIDAQAIASRLVSLNAHVAVWLPNEPDPRRVRSIPDGDFALAEIECIDVPITDEDLQQLSVAGQLTRLTIENEFEPTQLSAKGIHRLLKTGFPRLENVTMTNQPFDDRHLAALVATSPGLVSIRLTGGNVTDDGLRELAKLRALRTILFRNLPIDGTGLGSITSDVETLGLRDLKLDETAVLNFPSWPNLVALSLDQSVLSDRALQSFRRYKRLQSIRAGHVRNQTSEGWRFLDELSELEHLTIKENPTVTDEVIATLRSLTRLRHLGLDGTRVSDAGLQHLSSLPWLERLNLRRNPQLSSSALSALQDSLPNCQITDVDTPGN
ncbi:MAG: protein kinase [Planctomycetota bacterium]